MGDQRVEVQPTQGPEPANAEKSPAQAKTPSPGQSYFPPQGMNVFGVGSPDDIPLTRDNLLYLQRTVGNRAVAQLLQRKAKSGLPANNHIRPANDDSEQVSKHVPSGSPRTPMPDVNLASAVQRVDQRAADGARATRRPPPSSRTASPPARSSPRSRRWRNATWRA